MPSAPTVVVRSNAVMAALVYLTPCLVSISSTGRIRVQSRNPRCCPRRSRRVATVISRIGTFGQNDTMAAAGPVSTPSGTHTIAAEMADARVRGLHRVALRGPEGEAIDVVLEFRVRRVHVLPPIGKQRRYPALDLTVLHVTERDPPRGREPIEWKLLTDLPVRSRGDAQEKVRWNAMRWKIETFHKILKPGCRAEESRLLSAERIANLLALFCIIAWRILWLTLAHRANPGAAPQTALSERECRRGNTGRRYPASSFASAVISAAHVIRRPASPSYGAGCRASPISNSGWRSRHGRHVGNRKPRRRDTAHQLQQAD